MGTIFFDLRASIDEEWVFADGSYIRCHQHSSGARRGELRATGKSRGRTTTKIHLAVDSHGNPIDFKITEGDVHDSKAVDDIIEMLTDATYFIADKAYDSETIRTRLKQDNISPVIPKRKNAKQPDAAFDHYLYKLRHLVENTFARLKHFRSIATRYEKLARNYKSMLYLACTMIHCKLNYGHALVFYSLVNELWHDICTGLLLSIESVSICYQYRSAYVNFNQDLL